MGAAMEPKDRASVCWIFASEDSVIARDLISGATVLEAQGLLRSSKLSGAELGLDSSRGTGTLRRADVAMVLCSRALLGGSAWQQVLAIAAENPHTRVVTVVINVTTLPPELAAFQVLPRDGQPLMGRPDRQAALLDVIDGLRTAITSLPS
jgi:hypothetical protein